MARLLYTSAPRGEVTGTAEFVDAQNGLQAVVRFGRVEEAGAARCALLQRPDALCGALYRHLRSSPPGGGVARESSVGSVGSSGSWPAPAGDKVKRGSLSSKVRSGLSLGLRSSKSSPVVGEEGHRITLARCTGNWLSHLDWEEERWWTLLEEEAGRWEAVPSPLPSDCRYREDLALLAEGEVRGAQRAKELLEQRQRADARLRKEAAAAAAAASSGSH
ncbi:hypothetical protein CHLNCDRAFT_135777 [Chlorella variabilis]|uniref:Uncharacterized protein n=1 Tax=Chlorella variabilis TaxID=554065 RepID=E1ZIZ5_CHLVA|nr:hypothetical protein CHLNCDRAFT_135777 [Chlorella variabilis]EFN54246.1 hypothetical protein CHLNCDRAFT_135777 [Chlorella variabilis]|eukprot:XP_005846348.1 hypothetical protein CHLNCDRAFT_135777 [Chlorella variabilis]